MFKKLRILTYIILIIGSFFLLLPRQERTDVFDYNHIDIIWTSLEWIFFSVGTILLIISFFLFILLKKIKIKKGVI